MPLTYNCGGVTSLAEEFRKCLLVAVELVSIDQESVGVGIFTGLNGGSHGSADRIGNIALLEKHAVAGKGVNMWSRAMFLEPRVVHRQPDKHDHR